MRKLQLYIGTQRVDLFKDESVSLTQTIKNVKDIAKIFTEFTQTFSVPASSVNNKIFKHYYNSNIQDGFDARIKQNATIEINDLPFRDGKISLQGVELKNNLAHTYKITFFGNAVNFKDIISDDQLSSLSFSEFFNKDYSFDDVKFFMTTGTAPQMIVPLITHTNRLIYNSSSNETFNAEDQINNIYATPSDNSKNGVSFTEFKYAVRVPDIITAIQDRYNITFSSDFFNNNTTEKYSKLYMWLHRKSGNVEVPGQVPVIYNINQDFALTAPLPTAYVTSEQNGIITIAAPIGVTPTRLVFSINPINQNVPYNIQMLRNGAMVAEKINVQGSQSLTLSAGSFGTINNSSYQLQIAGVNISVASGNLLARVDWLEAGGNPFSGFDEYKSTATFTTGQVPQFNINQQIPEMKIMDFLSGLFKMFNLIAYVENDVIVVNTLDSYYAASTTTYNIDKYLDTTKSTTDVALPFNKVSFTYKGLKTFLAQEFNQLFNTKWGGLTFTLNGDIFDAPSEPYKIELPFEHMMYERLYDAGTTPPTSTDVQWGYSVNENQQPYKGEPLLFYAHKVNQSVSNTKVRVRDPFGTASPIDLQSYYIPSNSLEIDPTISKENIHFQAEINEYLANEPTTTSPPLSAQFTDTLFETEYKTYIQEIFNTRNRLTKVTAYLPMKVYYNLQLNDLIEMNQQTYKINSLTTDLTTGKTEFELLNTIL